MVKHLLVQTSLYKRQTTMYFHLQSFYKTCKAYENEIENAL